MAKSTPAAATEQRSCILSYSKSELRRLFADLGEPAYRADQLHRWLFSDRVKEFALMTNLGSHLRELLAERFFISSSSIAEKLREPTPHNTPATAKFLLELHDGEMVEAVHIPAADRNTVCVSSQVGCALQCSFCATGYMGFTRNLSASEIVEQVFLVNDSIASESPGNHLTNIVFMGMGEPLLNLRNVIEAIRTLCEPSYALPFSQRKITVSTVGILPQIEKLARSELAVKLAVSLHAADQEKRAALIPAAKEHTLENLRRALEDYAQAGKERVTLVYMLLDGVNDTRQDAEKLARFGRSFLCKINLIDYNSIVKIRFNPVREQQRQRFIQILVDHGLQVTVRKSHGASIHAACGQLALRKKTTAAS